MKKSIFSLLLALLPLLASAYDAKVDGIYYNFNSTDKTAEVTYYTDEFSPYGDNGIAYIGEVKIPSNVTYKGVTYSVTSIGRRAFYHCGSLTSITISNSIKAIGVDAFWACINLSSVEIPNSVKIIDKNAFLNCSSLTSVIIPNSVTNIEEGAFRDCSNLASITIPNSVTTIGADAFSGTAWFNNQPDGLLYINKMAYRYKGTMPDNTEFIIKEGTLKIVERAFHSCYGLTSVAIPNSVSEIGGEAFNGCYNLKSVNIPNGVTSINGSSFSFCESLSSITIPSSVTSIGEDAFWYCKSLTSITISKSVKFIDDKAFSGCDGLTSIVVEEGNSVYDSRNNCNAIIETASNTIIAACGTTLIPNTVTKIGNHAFRGLRSLYTLEIPKSVTEIGDCAFFDCGLLSLTIPNSVTKIGDDAFRRSYGLRSITIPNSVSYIGESLFAECYSLAAIVIGKNVEIIKGNPFYECYRLKDIYCYAEKVPEKGEHSLGFRPQNENTILHVPAASMEAYKTSTAWNRFTNIVPLEEIESLIESKETTFGGEDNPIHEETDLTDAIIDNTYYSMDAGNGDGFDAESQALVLNTTNTEEQMSTVTDGKVGDDAVRENYIGIIFKFPSWNGKITLDLQTLGSHALYLQLGKDKPIEIAQTERGTVTIAFNLVEPTYIYLYASTAKDAAASRTRGTAENSVLLYGYKVDLDWGVQNGDANGNGIFDEEDIELVKESILNRADRYTSYDANGDGSINIADIVTINNLMSGKNSCIKVNPVIY